MAATLIMSQGFALEISEQKLSEMARKGSPQLDQIEAAFLSAMVQKNQTQEGFAPELFGRTSYAETNERPILSFFPVWSPVKQGQLGVRQDLQRGVTAEAAVTADQRSAVTQFTGKLQNITTTTLSFTMQMDLWQDLFGRLSKSKLENAGLDAKRAELEREIQNKAFVISLRRLYWSLVANQESLRVSEELLKTAQRQSSDINLRFKNSIAESDEVARYEAQVASRRGTLLYLQFQRETFLRQLRNLLPELGTEDITLGNYDLNQASNEILACAGTIVTHEKVPLEYTKYDDMTALMRTIRTNAAQINARYSDVDLKLYGSVKTTGVGSNAVNQGLTRGSYGAAIDDATGHNRAGYEVGVRFSLPLGDAKKLTQKSKELYDEKRLSAAIDGSDVQVATTHQQFAKAVGLLNEVIRTQRVSSEQLTKRLAGMRRKYEQARVSVNDLVNDQDALLNSELTTIQTQLQLLNVLFDYFVIYTDTPCPFNRI